MKTIFVICALLVAVIVPAMLKIKVIVCEGTVKLVRNVSKKNESIHKLRVEGKIKDCPFTSIGKYGNVGNRIIIQNRMIMNHVDYSLFWKN